MNATRNWGPSTWVGASIVALLLLLTFFTPIPFVWVFFLFGTTLVTALYALITGRHSWLRFGGRKVAAIGVAASIVVGFTSMAAAAATMPVPAAVKASQSATVPQATNSATASPAPSQTTQLSPSPTAAPQSSTAEPSTTASSAVTTSPSAAPPVAYSAAVRAPGGAVLPDKATTPGATNPAVTPSTIDTTICVTGWTAQVRPPEEYTSNLKVSQLAGGYTYNGDTNPADYEEDHLIPLELGGAPSDVHSLWPEPSTLTSGGAKSKDELENKLHELVCAGTLGLGTAQQAIASDWWAAYSTYVVAPAPAAPAPAAPAPAAPAPAAPAPAPAGGPAGATALCVDGTYSYSAHHSGTCSHHHGVAVWYK
ncbi:hypothetical protein ACVWWH_001833 [Sinomonas sp. RB5]